MSSLLFHLYILVAILVLYNLYTLIAIILLPVSSDFPTQTLGASPYQFLMFTQQWPKAVNESSPLAKFTIHGLWPSNSSGQVVDCPGTRFNKSQITPLLEKNLNESSPNVENGTNMWFWQYEYNRHGRCSEDTFNQTKYFELANDMWGKLNIAQMLANRNIVPGGNYTKFRVADAIENENQNKSPSIRCKNGSTGLEVLLLEVVVCYDHDGKKVIDCKRRISRSCWSQNISYVN